ncbi:TetR/AcrR family transcriptional regulator [Actinocrispum wychmicini]|uniref:TetR family transcriptional regulator n=1 Tax=Actinocrispum wychmicini TaxID=1213861 RepID=A0A4R2IVS6_9PSEU|nr:TetR/AcrR family transcriptional regulator [Actinocrispum wychmicini]TCO49793.1 TetR family transcriptional regulator [Actinocrispum wychmicini]
MVQRMPRVERREQILDAATRAFARSGYTATGLDDVAAEAGITRVLLYRHFDSKNDMYRAVLERARLRLQEQLGSDGYHAETIPALLRAAAADPDGFRLLFRHAAREPEFRDVIDTFRSHSRDVAYSYLMEIPHDAMRDWAARLLPTVTLEAVLTWLDAGQPDPDRAPDRIRKIVQAVIQATAESSS